MEGERRRRFQIRKNQVGGKEEKFLLWMDVGKRTNGGRGEAAGRFSFSVGPLPVPPAGRTNPNSN